MTIKILNFNDNASFFKKIFKNLLLLLVLLSLSHSSHAALLNELFVDGSFQIDNLLMTDWKLLNAVNVNVNNIDIGEGYGAPDDFGVWSINRELRVTGSESLSLTYDFRVTGVGVNIKQATGRLAYRSVVGPTAVIKGDIAIGTSRGRSDLGTTTDVYRLSDQGNNNSWINLPDGINEIWVRNTISLSSNYWDNSAEGGGYIDGAGYGPAFLNCFKTETVVPIPAAIFFLGSGLIGLVGVRCKLGT